MNNVMTHIELTQATPITKAPPSQHSLHSLAAGLLSVFGKAETNDKTRFLIQAALEGYTYAEFSEAMRKAQSMAAEADKKAVDTAMQECPREQNEPMRDYLQRIEKVVEENKTLMAMESLAEALDTAAAKIVAEWGTGNAMSIAEKILAACQEQAHGID